MIEILDYILNKDELLYIEKYAFDYLIVHFKNGDRLEINCYSEDDRNRVFDHIKF